VFFCRNRAELSVDLFRALMNNLPITMHPEITRFQRWQDRQATLMGKMLLAYAVQQHTGMRLDWSQRAWNAYKRPYLPGVPDFNIAHSGEWVTLALAEKGGVGIDVEQKKPVDPAHYRSIYSPEEWSMLQQASDREAFFFDVWTRKEAVCKADGMGLYRDLDHINTLENPVMLEGCPWHLRRLPVGPGCAGHLASTHPISKCSLQAVDVLRIFVARSV
jgi:4'-phosphopantetheinyl transferase